MKRTAVITGASRGIGYAIAKQLGLDGYNVVVVATGPQEKNQAALDALTELNIQWAYVQANIGDHDDRLRIVSEALAAFGRIDALVNNAGVAPLIRADLLEMTEESFDRVIGINTKGNMFLTQAVAKQMISQEPLGGRKGVIVNVSSCSSVVSSISRGEYCVSKAGVSMLTTLFADRLAAEGILVHEIRPGVTEKEIAALRRNHHQGSARGITAHNLHLISDVFGNANDIFHQFLGMRKHHGVHSLKDVSAFRNNQKGVVDVSVAVRLAVGRKGFKISIQNFFGINVFGNHSLTFRCVI